MSARLAKNFKDYASYHKTPGNKFCHYFGIPLVMVTLLGLLSGWVAPANGLTGSEYFRLDGGMILWILGMAWYLVLDWKIAIPFGFVSLGLYFIGRAIPLSVLWGLFVLAWVLQFIGHYVFEKKSPAFFKNLQHLLVGPLWIFVRLIGYKP